MIGVCGVAVVYDREMRSRDDMRRKARVLCLAEDADCGKPQ